MARKEETVRSGAERRSARLARETQRSPRFALALTEREARQLTEPDVFYDVFGLDDDDLHEFGASSDAFYSSNASIGITAWWQLQHQHGYAPLVTRIVHEQTWTAPAT